MGLIKAFTGALGGTTADQWREYFYCDSLSADTLVAKGQKRVSGRSSNRKGEENIISNGSVIAVNEGQCMIIVEQGKVTETIDNENSTGTVYVDGKIWTARSADGTRIPAGSQVEIQRMEGVKLFVRELSSQESGAEREMEKEEA